jgi:hypothetical protein
MRLVAVASDIVHPSFRIDYSLASPSFGNPIVSYRAMGCFTVEQVQFLKITSKVNTNVFLHFARHFTKAFKDYNNEQVKNLILSENEIFNFIKEYLTTNEDIKIFNIPFEYFSVQKRELNEFNCFWKNFNSSFDQELDIKNNTENFLYFLIGYKSDADWKNQKVPDPQVKPQSHLVNRKLNSSFYEENENFFIQSSTYFTSNPIVYLKNHFLIEVDDPSEIVISNDNIFIQFEVPGWKVLPKLVLKPKNLNYEEENLENSGEINRGLYLSPEIKKSSEIYYDLHLNLLITDNFEIQDYINKEYPSSSTIKFKLILDKSASEYSYHDEYCTLSKIKENEFNEIYISCEMNLESKKYDINFIRQSLSAAIFYIDLESIKNQYSSAKTLESKFLNFTNSIGTFGLSDIINKKFSTSSVLYSFSNLSKDVIGLLNTNPKDKLKIIDSFKNKNISFSSFSNELSFDPEWIINFERNSGLFWDITFYCLTLQEEYIEKVIVKLENIEITFDNNDILNKKAKPFKIPFNFVGGVINTLVFFKIPQRMKLNLNKNKFYNLTIRENLAIISKILTILPAKLNTLTTFDLLFDFSQMESSSHLSDSISLLLLAFLGALSILFTSTVVFLVVYLLWRRHQKKKSLQIQKSSLANTNLKIYQEIEKGKDCDSIPSEIEISQRNNNINNELVI